MLSVSVQHHGQTVCPSLLVIMDDHHHIVGWHCDGEHISQTDIATVVEQALDEANGTSVHLVCNHARHWDGIEDLVDRLNREGRAEVAVFRIAPGKPWRKPSEQFFSSVEQALRRLNVPEHPVSLDELNATLSSMIDEWDRKQSQQASIVSAT